MFEDFQLQWLEIVQQCTRSNQASLRVWGGLHAGVTAPVATIDGLTTLTYYTKKKFNSPQIKPFQSFLGGDNFNAAGFCG